MNVIRKPLDLCLLCNENNSTKEKSHLIPKFFGKGIFEGTKPRHAVALDKKGNKEKIQDIIKEDYLFCPDCEKGFSIFETYCALRLERFNSIRYYSQFNIVKKGELKYFECKELDVRIFNLFIYSVVWRVSICENPAFQKFKLPNQDEEKLRKLLKNFIEPTQTDLIHRLDELDSLPNHSHLILRPRKIMRPPKSMLSAVSHPDAEWFHQLHLVDYMIFYLTDPNKLAEESKEIDNNKLDGLIRITLIKPELWEEYNFKIIKKMF